MPLITCEDAAFAYEGRIVASGLNFALESGDYLCVVGENGSGKSTLIRGLLRLRQPVQGRLLLGDGLKANEIGYLPQQTAARNDFPASVAEVVLSGRLGRRGALPFYSRADKAAAAKHMQALGIAAIRNKCFSELSAGQQQRTLLARSLCAAYRLLLLDEPMAGLDPPATRELYRQIQCINREDGITIIMVSHDIPGAVKNAGRILHLKNKQLFFGTAADYARSHLGQSFLGKASDCTSERKEAYGGTGCDEDVGAGEDGTGCEANGGGAYD